MTDDDQIGFHVAIELARSSDIFISFGSISQTVESESCDRVCIILTDV